MRVFHGRLARLVITGLAVCACTARAGAQTQFEVIHRFSEVDPPYAPGAGLVQGTDGQFYGTTSFGGPGGHGTVFKVTPGGAVTVLHVFDGTDGDRPFARLVQASDGNFYGTATTIFRVQPDGAFTVLGAGGPIKSSAGNSLVQAGDGNLYGAGLTTTDASAIFRLTLAGQVSIFYQCTITCRNVTLGPDGALYGTTRSGGAAGGGTAFRLTTPGVFQTLHEFTTADGRSPSGLFLGSDGNFYGTTSSGGSAGLGTIFRMSSTGAVTVLYSFAERPSPSLGVVQTSDGDLYGVLPPWNNCGAIFRLTSSGSYSIAHAFLSTGEPCTLSVDGDGPNQLVEGSDGAVYGTTDNGGDANRGSVFRMTLDGTLTTLYSFLHGPDGEYPDTAPIQASNGLFYGTTPSGGIYDKGVVYVMAGDGTVTVLYAFAGGFADGAHPHGPLLQASDGSFYGTTSGGGGSACGTIFRITTAGTFQILHHFTCGTGGSFPFANLIQGRDGSLYGTTRMGGSSDNGTVFRITMGGDFAILHAFGSGSADGAAPTAGLVQAANGDFYGTTDRGGGASGFGVVFRMTPTGTTTTVQSFPNRLLDSTSFFEPVPGLIEGVDGKLYGNYRGPQSRAFSVAGNAYSNFYAFAPFTGSAGGFLQASDGNFYGWGRNHIYQLTDGGLFTVLYTLDTATEGDRPVGELVQGADLRLYGVTQFGVTHDPILNSRGGTIVRLTLPFLQPTVALTVSVNGGPSQIAPIGIAAGASTLWTASVTGGRGPFQYQFWINGSAGWRIVRDYSSDPTLRWTPSAASSYALQVWIRNAGSTSSWDAFGGSGAFSVGPPAAIVASSLAASPSVPRATGETATWTASASGGVGPLQYQFWISEPGTGWRIIKPWSAAAQIVWTPLVAGSYNLQVWVRSAASTASYDAWLGTGSFAVANGALSIVSLAADQAVPIGAGTTVTWTATAAGGDGTPLEYRFWRYHHNTATWTIVRDYQASRTWAWMPTGSDLGMYSLQVWARRQGSGATWEAWRGTDAPFNVTAGPIAVTLSSDQGDPPNVPPGTRITFRAITTGSAGPIEYQFWRYDRNTQTWTSTGYSASDSYVWTPSALDAGSSIVQVWVRVVGSSAAYNAWATTGTFSIWP